MKSRLLFDIDHHPWVYRKVCRNGITRNYTVLYGRYGYKGPPAGWTLVHPPPEGPWSQFYSSIIDANTQAYRNILDFQSHSRQ